MLSVPWVKQHHKGGVAHTLLWKPFSLPSLQPQEGHILKLNSLALLSLWLCVNHQKRSKPECPPPYPNGVWCRLASLVFTSNWSFVEICLAIFCQLIICFQFWYIRVPLMQLETCPFKKPILQFLSTHALDQLYLPQRWCHQHKDSSWFPPHALGIQILKSLNFVSRSPQEETGTA